MRENPLKVRRPAAVAGAGAFSQEAKALLHGGSSTECDRKPPAPQYPNGMAPLVGLKAVLDAMSNDHTAATSVPRAEHDHASALGINHSA